MLVRSRGTRVASFARIFVDSHYCDGRECSLSQSVLNVTTYDDGDYQVEVCAPNDPNRVSIFAGPPGAEQRFVVAMLRALRRVGDRLPIGQ